MVNNRLKCVTYSCHKPYIV